MILQIEIDEHLDKKIFEEIKEKETGAKDSSPEETHNDNRAAKQ